MDEVRFVLTIDWLDDFSTVRQSVDLFKDEQVAKTALKEFDVEVKEWVDRNHPDTWKREGDGETFIEYGKPGNYYDSHAVAKITRCVTK